MRIAVLLSPAGKRAGMAAVALNGEAVATGAAAEAAQTGAQAAEGVLWRTLRLLAGL